MTNQAVEQFVWKVDQLTRDTQDEYKNRVWDGR